MIDAARQLSAAEVEHYREQGYVIVERLLDEQTIAGARDAMTVLMEGARGVSEHTELYDLDPAHRPDDPRVRRLKMPHRHDPFYHALARSPRIVDIVRQLLGPAIRIQHSKINLKAPRYGAPVEWHQDFAGFPHTNDDLLAVGVMLEEGTHENGPLLLLPRTHRGPIYNHHANGYYAATIDHTAVDLDFEQAVPVVGPPGTVSFHHVRLVHGSAQNRSELPRPLLLFEYAAVDAWPLAGLGKHFTDLASFDAEIVCGEPTLEPRLAPVPVRMPLPLPESHGSIYERQRMATNRYFTADEEPTAT